MALEVARTPHLAPYLRLEPGFQARLFPDQEMAIERVARAHCPQSAGQLIRAYRNLATAYCLNHADEGWDPPTARTRLREAAGRPALGPTGDIETEYLSDRTLERYWSSLVEAGLIRLEKFGGRRARIVRVYLPGVLERHGGMEAHRDRAVRRMALARQYSAAHRARRQGDRFDTSPTSVSPSALGGADSFAVKAISRPIPEFSPTSLSPSRQQIKKKAPQTDAICFSVAQPTSISPPVFPDIKKTLPNQNFAGLPSLVHGFETRPPSIDAEVDREAAELSQKETVEPVLGATTREPESRQGCAEGFLMVGEEQGKTSSGPSEARPSPAGGPGGLAAGGDVGFIPAPAPTLDKVPLPAHQRPATGAKEGSDGPPPIAPGVAARAAFDAFLAGHAQPQMSHDAAPSPDPAPEPSPPPARRRARMTPSEFEMRLRMLIEGGTKGEHRTASAEHCLGEDWPLVQGFVGSSGLAWFGGGQGREDRERFRRVLTAHSVAWNQLEAARRGEAANAPPLASFPNPDTFKRTLQAIVHGNQLHPNRDELAARQLGPAWDQFVAPMTHGLGMRWFDDQIPVERSKRLRMVAGEYEAAWSRLPGNPTPREATKGADRMASVPAAADPARVPLPPPGPREMPASLPWLTSDQLATVIEDLVEHRADETLAARILGAWAFGVLTGIRPWPAWVAGCREANFHLLAQDAHNVLGRSVSRARLDAQAARSARGLPEDQAGWAARLRADLDLPERVIISATGFDRLRITPDDYEQALTATRKAVGDGRVDLLRAPGYLMGCLKKAAQGRM